jgi:restriction endonuclease
MYTVSLTILIFMLIGSNYQLEEQRKHNELVIEQCEHILITAKMLEDRQDELKRSLAASEKQRQELLGLWERVNPKYLEEAGETLIAEEVEALEDE